MVQEDLWERPQESGDIALQDLVSLPYRCRWEQELERENEYEQLELGEVGTVVAKI